MVLLTILGGLVGICGLIVFGSVFRGYALSVLWGWFIVPTFDVQPLSIAPAIGIAMMVNYLTYHVTSDVGKENMYAIEESPNMILAKTFALDFLKPAVIIGFGWIVHLFI